MRLWLILVAKQPLKERRQRGEREKEKEREGERGRETPSNFMCLGAAHRAEDVTADPQTNRHRAAEKGEGSGAGRGRHCRRKKKYSQRIPGIPHTINKVPPPSPPPSSFVILALFYE